MMKKYLILGMLCLIVTQIQAQVIKIDFDSNNEIVDDNISPIVREKIDKYAIEIREIVIEKKLDMKEEIDQVDLDLNEGKINEEEADILKSAISIRFSDKINSDIETLEFDLDEIIKQQVKYSVLNTDVHEFQKKKSKPKGYSRANHVSGYLAYGMISLPNSDNQKLNDHIGYSSGIDLGLIYNRQFSKTSPFVFKSGAYLSWRTLRFEDNYLISRDNNGVVDLVQHDGNLKKSKLRATYLMFPIGVKYSTSKIRTDKIGESYRNPDKGFGITANVYGGFKLSNNNIVKGDNISFRHRKTDLNLNGFVYGAQLTMSVFNTNFFVRQEFSPYFKSNTFDDRKLLQFGINFGF